MNQELTKEYLVEHKQDLMKYENQFKVDLSNEIKETDKIIREFISKELRPVNSVLWEERQQFKIKVPKEQQRLI